MCADHLSSAERGVHLRAGGEPVPGVEAGQFHDLGRHRRRPSYFLQYCRLYGGTRVVL